MSETACDLRSRGSHLERATEPFERAPFPARSHLDLPAGQVRDPAAQSEPPRLLAHEPPKADALHASGDPDVKRAHVCCSQPWVPKRGTKRTGAMSEIRTSVPRRCDELEYLLIEAAHRHDHPAAIGELLDEWLRNRRVRRR